MKDDFEKYMNKQLKIESFRKEWDALQPEYIIMRAVLEMRKERGLTQKELSARTGITQGDISRLENGNGNPSIKTLKRLADAMGMSLKIEFVDPDSTMPTAV